MVEQRYRSRQDTSKDWKSNAGYWTRISKQEQNMYLPAHWIHQIGSMQAFSVFNTFVLISSYSPSMGLLYNSRSLHSTSSRRRKPESPQCGKHEVSLGSVQFLGGSVFSLYWGFNITKAQPLIAIDQPNLTARSWTFSQKSHFYLVPDVRPSGRGPDASGVSLTRQPDAATMDIYLQFQNLDAGSLSVTEPVLYDPCTVLHITNSPFYQVTNLAFFQLLFLFLIKISWFLVS